MEEALCVLRRDEMTSWAFAAMAAPTPTVAGSNVTCLANIPCPKEAEIAAAPLWTNASALQPMKVRIQQPNAQCYSDFISHRMPTSTPQLQDHSARCIAGELVPVADCSDWIPSTNHDFWIPSLDPEEASSASGELTTPGQCHQSQHTASKPIGGCQQHRSDRDLGAAQPKMDPDCAAVENISVAGAEGVTTSGIPGSSVVPSDRKPSSPVTGTNSLKLEGVSAKTVDPAPAEAGPKLSRKKPLKPLANQSVHRNKTIWMTPLGDHVFGPEMSALVSEHASKKTVVTTLPAIGSPPRFAGQRIAKQMAVTPPKVQGSPAVSALVAPKAHVHTSKKS